MNHIRTYIILLCLCFTMPLESLTKNKSHSIDQHGNDKADSHFNHGITLSAQGKEQEAQKEYQETLKYNAKHSKARMKIVDYLQKKEEYDEAIKHCNILIQDEPTNSEFLQKMAQLYFAHNNIDDAIIYYRKALLLNPKQGQLLLEYGNTLNLNSCADVAHEIYRAINDVGIKSLSVSYNMAYTLKKLEKYDLAIAACKDIIAHSPDYAQAHFTLGTSYLTLGNYQEGWKEYEWRWKQPNAHEHTFRQPHWNGSNLRGKTILLHAEQGLGDTFQFIRYAKIAKDQEAHVIAAVQAPLVQILSLCPYIDTVTQLDTLPKDFDTHAALLTLPLILNTQEETIPAMHPYLFADETLVALWKEKLKDDKNFKIGICWQGNPNYSTHFLRLVVASKSIRPSTFAPIGTIPGITLYSLQKDHANNVDESLPEGFIVHTFDGNFDKDHGRFMDTAAVMKNLDLVITVDTSIAHLAGGLGVPVWVMLPKPADWRWLIGRTDSPWYPTMRLFRQTVTGNWTTVIDEICEALKLRVREYHEKGKISWNIDIYSF